MKFCLIVFSMFYVTGTTLHRRLICEHLQQIWKEWNAVIDNEYAVNRGKDAASVDYHQSITYRTS